MCPARCSGQNSVIEVKDSTSWLLPFHREAELLRFLAGERPAGLVRVLVQRTGTRLAAGARFAAKDLVAPLHGRPVKLHLARVTDHLDRCGHGPPHFPEYPSVLSPCFRRPKQPRAPSLTRRSCG